MTSGSLWNYYRDEVNDNANENDADKYGIGNRKTVTSKSLEYNTKITGSTPAGNLLDTEVVVPSKSLSNFCRCLYLSLINCKIELDLSGQ